jgi:hypothetical protein
MSIHDSYDGYEVFASPKRGPESAAMRRLVSAKFDPT